MRFSGSQCRAARALVGVTPKYLADLAGLQTYSVQLHESGEHVLTLAEFEALGAALHALGVVAVAGTTFAGEGVRLRLPAGSINDLIAGVSSAEAAVDGG